MAVSPTRVKKSATNRDLPTPAGPIKVNRRVVRDAAASEKSAASRSSSRWRPTIGRSRWRATPVAAASNVISRYAVTGFGLPLSDSSKGSVITASRTRFAVVSPSSTSPGAADCSSRAATLTASPMTKVSPSTATTSPVFTPIRASRPRSCTASRSSTAALTARSASSSVATGMPKTAITASPTNFSTVPP